MPRMKRRVAKINITRSIRAPTTVPIIPNRAVPVIRIITETSRAPKTPDKADLCTFTDTFAKDNSRDETTAKGAD